MYNQHKKITQSHDKNMGCIFVLVVFIIEQQDGHHDKGKAGNAGGHSAAALHLAIEPQQRLLKKAAVQKQEKKV